MAFFQSLGIVPFLIVMPSNRASYGIVASRPIFTIAPGMPSGPTDLFHLTLPNNANINGEVFIRVS